MKESIFILGGSHLQSVLLEAAKVKNYTTYILDGNPNCALAKDADIFIHQDFSDVDKVIDLVRKYDPQLVITIANEHGNLVAAQVSAVCGLTYNSVDTVFATINKAAMKKKLIEAGIPTPSLIAVCEDPIVDQDTIKNITFPIVVKPSQSSGGRGVTLVNNVDELNKAIMVGIQQSKDKKALVEEFYDADQYSVETISYNGRHKIIGITREFFGPKPYFAEVQHLFPAILDEHIETDINLLVFDLLNQFDIQYGASHIELRHSKDGGLMIIEIASRIGGWRSEMVQLAFGINYAELLLDSYQQIDCRFSRCKSHNFAIVKMLFAQEDIDRYDALSCNNKYLVTPIFWTKASVLARYSSVMDSAGYYYIQVKNKRDIEEALL